MSGNEPDRQGLILWTQPGQPGPEGGLAARVGTQGSTKL